MQPLPPGFVATEVPARIADLALSFYRPGDWVVADLPAETPDFTKPQTFLALAIAMAPFAAIVFGIGARPVFDDGSLAQWLDWLARDQGYVPGPIERETTLPQPAVGCWATQQSGDTPLRMRLVLFEDGGRLIQVTMMAPQALWQSVHDTLWTMYASLRLARPNGSAAAVAPAGVSLPGCSFVAMTRRPVPSPDPAPMDSVVSTPADAAPAPGLIGEAGPAANYADLALADDASAHAAEHPLNQRLFEQGAGFPLRIITDHGPTLRGSTVLAPALQATFCLPYGWHGMDDSRRCLVHDGAGGVQIDLSRRDHQGLDAEAFLLAVLAAMQRENPDLEGQRINCNGVEAMLVRGLTDRGEPLAQAWLLREAPQQQFLTLRCTARPEDLDRTGNLAELILRDLVFLDQAIAGPSWWQQAVRLEQQGQIAEAEQCIQQSVPHLGAYAQNAQLHELRGQRLTRLGDSAGAKAAFARSCEWMDIMVSSATSGGEAMALAVERDQHRQRLFPK